LRLLLNGLHHLDKSNLDWRSNSVFLDLVEVQGFDGAHDTITAVLVTSNDIGQYSTVVNVIRIIFFTLSKLQRGFGVGISASLSKLFFPVTVLSAYGGLDFFCKGVSNFEAFAEVIDIRRGVGLVLSGPGERQILVPDLDSFLVLGN
jgi:hypothetical protein